MVRVRHSLTIDRPPAAVFAALTDTTRLHQWQKTVESAYPEPAGPLELGSLLHETRSYAGRRFESVLEVTAYESDRRLDLETRSGPIAITVRHALTAANGGTQLDFEIGGEPSGLMRFASRVIEKTTQGEVEANFAELKRLLEAA